jgi:hypothetical protein
MEIGDEILVKAKVVDLDSDPNSSAVKVEVLGFVDADELNRLLYGHGDTETKKNKLFFWIHRLDQPKVIVETKNGLIDLNIMIEKRGDPQCRMFHLNTRISLIPHDTVFSELNALEEERFNRLGPIGASLVKKVLTIPGVFTVSVSNDYLFVSINRAASWEKVEPAVIDAFRDALGRMKEEVKTSYLN